jgi:hypothetical protein
MRAGAASIAGVKPFCFVIILEKELTNDND